MCSTECRNELVENHYIKHAKIDRRLQTGVGKQHSLCSLQTSAKSPVTQRRMSKQWSMPSSSSDNCNCADSTGGGGSSGQNKDRRTTTLAKSSSCRSTVGSTTKRVPSNWATEITIDIADVDDDVAMTSKSAAATRRPVVRNSSVASDRHTLDVYYDSKNR